MASLEEVRKEYEMTEEEINDMYERVARSMFENIAPNANGIPECVITGGQPGSGKSGLVSTAATEFRDEGKQCIVLDVDLFRGFYKNAGELATRYPEYYSEITDKPLGVIMRRLLEETITKGYNFIFEGTLANTQIVETIRKYNNNYRIKAKLMATSKYESLLSLFERYLEMKQYIGMGRLTSIDAHNVRYDSFTALIPTLEGKGIEVDVYERGATQSTPILLRADKDNSRFPTVQNAVEFGRSESQRACMKNAERRLTLIEQEIIQLNDRSVMDEFQKLQAIFRKDFFLQTIREDDDSRE